jgi:hypothetical protein
MRRHAAVALLFACCSLAHAGGGWINPDTGAFYPRIEPHVAIDPETGEAFVPAAEPPPSRARKQRAETLDLGVPPAMAPNPPQPSAAEVRQRREMAHWCQQVHSIAATVQHAITVTPKTDPLYRPLHVKLQNYRDAYRNQCQG